MAINNKKPAHLEMSRRRDNLFMEFVESVKKGALAELCKTFVKDMGVSTKQRVSELLTK